MRIHTLKHSRMGRGLSLFLSLSFFVPIPFASAQSPIQTPKPVENKTLLILENLPSELASVKIVREARGDQNLPVIVILEDLHANSSAQMKILEILKWLYPKFSSIHVGLEGAEGPLHSEYLSIFKDFPKANEAMVQELYAKAEISGPELFLWETAQNQKPADLFGVEDPALYQKNLKTFRSMVQARPEIDAALGQIQSRFEWVLSRSVHPGLRRFMRERAKRKEISLVSNKAIYENASLRAYAEYLTEQAFKVLSIDLHLAQEQIRFPQLVRLLRYHESARELDFPTALREWKELSRIMRQKSRKEWERGTVQALDFYARNRGLLAEGADFRGALEKNAQSPGSSSRKLLEKIVLFSEAHSLELQDYPQFLNSFRLFTFSSEMDMEDLSEEIELLEQMLMNALANNDKEKDLIERVNDFELLGRLLHLKLTRQDMNAWSGRKSRVARLFEEVSAQKRMILEAALSKAEMFYQDAETRERHFLERLLQKRDGGLLVLVTGGFHVRGISDLLRENGLPHAEVRPRVLDHEDALYEKNMMEEEVDLSAFFRKPHPFQNKRNALLFKMVLEKGIPSLQESYGLDLSKTADVLQKSFQAHPWFSQVIAPNLNESGSTVRLVPRLNSQVAYASKAALSYPLILSENYLGAVVLTPQEGTQAETLVIEATDKGFIYRTEPVEKLEWNAGNLKITSGYLPQEILNQETEWDSQDPTPAEIPRPMIDFVRAQSQTFKRNAGRLQQKSAEEKKLYEEARIREFDAVLAQIQSYQGKVRFNEIIRYAEEMPKAELYEEIRKLSKPAFSEIIISFLNDSEIQSDPDSHWRTPLISRLFLETFHLTDKTLLKKAAQKHRILSRWSVWAKIFHHLALKRVHETQREIIPAIRIPQESGSIKQTPFEQLLSTTFSSEHFTQELNAMAVGDKVLPPRKIHWTQAAKASKQVLLNVFPVAESRLYYPVFLKTLQNDPAESRTDKLLAKVRAQLGPQLKGPWSWLGEKQPVPAHFIVMESGGVNFEDYRSLYILALQNKNNRVTIVAPISPREAQKMEAEIRDEAERLGIEPAFITILPAKGRVVQEALRAASHPAQQGRIVTGIIGRGVELESMPRVKEAIRINWGGLDKIQALVLSSRVLLQSLDTASIQIDEVNLKNWAAQNHSSLDQLSEILDTVLLSLGSSQNPKT